MVGFKGKLIYFGDPMCSWCWGFSEHLGQLLQSYSDSLKLELVMGGLRPGGGDPWNDEMKQFLRGHWVHVQEASGQPFNFGLLETDSFNYDTEPPSRAVRVVRDLAPQSEFAFFMGVQRRFYVDNADPGEVEFYEPLCLDHHIDESEFKARFASALYQELVREDFVKSMRYGVSGFPTVLLAVDQHTAAVTRGYATYAQMSERLTAILDDPKWSFSNT